MSDTKEIYLQHAKGFMDSLTARLMGQDELADSLMADQNPAIMSLVGLDIAANLIELFAYNLKCSPTELWLEIITKSPVTAIHEIPDIKV